MTKTQQAGGPLNCSDSELCTYLQALAEGFLPTFYSDTSQSVRLSWMDIASKSYQHGKKTVCFHGFQSLEMSSNLTAAHGAELLKLYQEGFHAKTLAQQEKEQALKANEADCGSICQGLLAKYDPNTHSLKTAQRSLTEDLEQCLQTWPRWGLMRNGECYRRQALEHHISATEYGFSQETFATPTTMDSLPPKSKSALMREATITRKGRSKPSNLRDQVSNMHMWPTPTVSGNYNKKGASATSGDGLATAVKKWPTPQASDNRDRGNLSDPSIQRRIQKGKQIGLSTAVKNHKGGGTLNPMWVEWLMGWPIGWTDLKPLEMDKYQQWLDGHSQFCNKSKE